MTSGSAKMFSIQFNNEPLHISYDFCSYRIYYICMLFLYYMEFSVYLGVGYVNSSDLTTLICCAILT